MLGFFRLQYNAMALGSALWPASREELPQHEMGALQFPQSPRSAISPSSAPVKSWQPSQPPYRQ